MLAYYSNGGIRYHEAYKFPIFLRIFNLRTLAKFKEKEVPKENRNSKWAQEDVQDATTQGIQNKKMFRNIPQNPR